MRSLAILLLASLPILATPHVNSVEPSSGPTAGGTYVYVSGGDLVGFALACPSIDCADSVQIGGVVAQTVASTDADRIVIAPPHAAGTVDVVVNVAGRAKITIPN